MLKSGRREVSGSIPDSGCRPNRLEFSVVFSKTRVYTGSELLDRPPPTEGISSIVLGPTSGQLDLNLQPQPSVY